jgi:hypothetical protein
MCTPKSQQNLNKVVAIFAKGLESKGKLKKVRIK